MILSDALPVQFWLSSCNTYNETVPKGVHEKCFCAPWQCDDQIRIQFQEDFSPDVDYLLLIKDSASAYLSELTFTEIEAGIHSVAFSPETEGICDEDIALEIATEADIIRLLAPSSWDNKGGGFTDFDSRTATQFIEAITSGPDGVVSANMPLVVPTGTKITFTYTVVILGTWTSVQGIDVRFILRDTSGASVSTNSDLDYVIETNGTYVFTETLTATAETAKLELLVNTLAVSSGTANFTLTITPSTIIYADPLAYTDCLNVATVQDETELIEYSNARNFAGLVYSDISPDTSFNIRVPCRFFHESFPEEDEAIELTSSVITTSGEMKSQKLLEVQHAPYYFHKKLQLILKHQTLTINNTDYQKEEKYEINKGNPRWPLKSATCLLTEKNSVLRNVI